MAPDLAQAYLNLIASLMSVMGTSFILLCYLILRRRRHIRHALIINLTIADFINATDNSISGLWVLIMNSKLSEGMGCVVNGFIGQLSAQAVDCSILAITLVTMLIVTSRKNTAGLSLPTVVFICITSWILPITTSLIALANQWYRPASTNWCWIIGDPPYLRYVLSHGWRFGIMFFVTGVAIYLQVFLRRQARSMAPFNYLRDDISIQDLHHKMSARSLGINRTTSNSHADRDERDDTDGGRNTYIANWGAHNTPGSIPRLNNAADIESIDVLPHSTNDEQNSRVTKAAWWKRVIPTTSRLMKRSPCNRSNTSIEKAMLLNAYPIFYIILWLPGLANRISEALGYKVHTLETLQAATQLIGFANAITFGWNERVGEQLKEKFRERGWGVDVRSGSRSESRSGPGSREWAESVRRVEL